jgi:hypothetical protein
MATKEEREELAEQMDYVLGFLRDRAQDIANRDSKRKANATTTLAARETMFLDQLVDALHSVFDGKLPAPPVALTKKQKGKTERILNVVLSDTHYGSRLDAREVGRQYGPVEEARRTAAICRQVADYKRQYRSETELFVHLLGDIIQGQLHDPRDGAPLAEQVATAIRVLVQALVYLAREFPKGVTVFCSTGNHGRNKTRHAERGVNQKWDSIEMMVYVALREALRPYKNVKFEIPLSPHYTWQAFDQRGFATHGDTVLNPGYPNRAIQTESITKQINSINAAAGKKGEEYSLFVVGHVHTGSQTYLASGSVLMTNGCLLPPDSYALSIGIFETACGQWLWESVKGHIVGDSRFVTVDERTDADASLDAIIQPFSGF